MIYRIYDKKKKLYLDSNIYYVNQKGVIYKTSSVIPIKLQEQERYEVRIIELKPEEKGGNHGN